MDGNGYFQSFHRCVFLKPKMASFLSYDDPSVPLKRSYDLIIGEAGKFCHTATSTVSAFGEKTWSSSTGSR